MTVIHLAESHPTLEEVIGLAKDEVVVLRQPDGSAFAVSQLGDFEVKAELHRNNPDFLSFLRNFPARTRSSLCMVFETNWPSGT